MPAIEDEADKPLLLPHGSDPRPVCPRLHRTDGSPPLPLSDIVWLAAAVPGKEEHE